MPLTAQNDGDLLALLGSDGRNMYRERNHERWPNLMDAKTAAEYVGERSVDTFRRRVGKIWPRPLRYPGMGERWTRQSLDQKIEELFSEPEHDVADLL